ncbi:MAG: Methyltransferase-like protein [uncultured Thiotrichaceae bacterium]|uniref:Methyltransferase-like protein n=1 Tax=uncultured Thiotrichaceae bacterium TaxID=298394 RepID=A0A6S6U4A2_9GAMM|nr:MAG: Methyltransferase-like protein [uncultured Thiotrichaceae bacterium]
MNSYDKTPYKSIPILYTYLPSLAATGRLHGIDTEDPDQCRVLELGCAEGGNIIPQAWYFPSTTFVGIDLSQRQIKMGQNIIEKLELPNIQLLQADISSFKHQTDDKFHYILLHGVFSWVSAETQESIFRQCQSLLADNGLVYISYNTYPGWHSQMVFRDALKLDASLYPQKPIKERLKNLQAFFSAADNEFSNYHQRRLHELGKHSDSYLLHEFLEENNHPIYFKDFISRAQQHSLQYISDAYLPIDEPSLLGEKRHSFLKNIPKKIDRLQAMDFMIHQRFRRSILTHSGNKVREKFTSEHLPEVAFRTYLQSKQIASYNKIQEVKYHDLSNTKLQISVSHPITHAAISILKSHYPGSLSFNDLLQKSCQKVADEGDLKYLESIEHFYSELYLLVVDDWVALDTRSRQYAKLDSSKPLQISTLNYYYAIQQGFMPSPCHKAIDLGKTSKIFFSQLLHGTSGEALQAMYINEYKKKNKSTSINPFYANTYKKQAKNFIKTLERNGLLENK